MKIVKTFHLKIVIFTAVKIRCMLHGRVFVMAMTNVGTDPNFFFIITMDPIIRLL